jgi:hypothetical protein
LEVVGEIAMAEAQKGCGPLGKRLFGWRRYIWLVHLAVLLVAGLALQTVIDILVEGGFGVFGFLAVVLGGIPWMTRGIRANQRKAWAKRGVPVASSVVYRETEESLIVEGALSEIRLRWAGLTEIAPGNGAWLFIGQGAAYFLPKRLFADAAAERTFLEACLARMTPEARARSVEVSALVGRSGPKA